MTAPLHLVFNTSSRQGLLTLAVRLGGCLYEIENEGRPFTALVNGSFGNGKSMLALGIDFALNRRAYPRGGIPETLTVNAMDAEPLRSPAVAFHDYCTIIAASPADFDNRLNRVRNTFRDRRVVIGSNLRRSDGDRFDYHRTGLSSPLLDMHVLLIGTGKAFRRVAVVTFRDESLYEKMRRRSLRLPARGLEMAA